MGQNLKGNAKTGRAAAQIAVRHVPVEALTPDPRNARLHSARQVSRIADSIAAFGFNVPVLVDEKGVVVAGHGRLLAAKSLGLEEVPAIALEHLDDAERRAFVIADNRLAELASWDDLRLGAELEELKSLDLDFAIDATGFELGEIDLRIEACNSPSEDGRSSERPTAPRRVDARVSRSEDGRPSERRMDRVGRDQRPRLQEAAAVARAGETWTLGPNRLLCGEALDAAGCRALDAAIRRWQALAGESARLFPTGEPFDLVARSRRRWNGERSEGAVK